MHIFMQGLHEDMGYATVICQRAIFHKTHTQQGLKFVYGVDPLYLSVAGRFWFIPGHVPNEDRKCDLC